MDNVTLDLSAAAIALAVIGGAWGVLADRIATRWPEHDEEAGFHAGRRVGWRTVVVAVFGAVGLGMLPTVFGTPHDSAAVLDSASLRQPLVFAAFGAYVVVLVLLLATDLDQRLMPDLLTLPMIPLAFLFAVSGANPLVGGAWIPALGAAVVDPAGPLRAVAPVRRGRIRAGGRQAPRDRRA